jgi:ribose transport system substrate-binding protein
MIHGGAIRIAARSTIQGQQALPGNLAHNGTGVRDYIHVVDLARGHLSALSRLQAKPGLIIHNLGAGRGYSVLEMVKAFEEVSGREIAYRIADRRSGDIAACFADPDKAAQELGWRAERGVHSLRGVLMKNGINGKAAWWLFLLLLSAGSWAESMAPGSPADPLVWDGPRTGPAAQAGRTLVYIAEDLRNAGILAVGEAVREAAKAIGWQVRFLDIGVADIQREAVFDRALALAPDGLIFGGGDAVANQAQLQRFQRAGIPVVGWHTGPSPGPIAGTPVRINVTTDSLSVARRAAEYVIEDSQGKAGVVIFTDSRFAIALRKSDTMAEIIRRCAACTLLSVEDVALNDAARTMPVITKALLERYGDRWTHSLGINDLYFDHAVATLVKMGRFPAGAPANVSAGDGSPSAFMRIRNRSYQLATVPEPLFLQGWQLVDELNRIFSGMAPSGYVNPAFLVTVDNIRGSTNAQQIFDPPNHYRTHYRHIWSGGAP